MCAGVVAYNMHGTVAIEAIAPERIDIALLRDISDYCMDVRAPRSKLIARLCESFVLYIADYHLHAGGREA